MNVNASLGSPETAKAASAAFGARNGFHLDTRIDRGPNQPLARIGNCRRPGVRNERDVFAAL